MGNARNRVNKSTRKKRPQEVIEEEKEKKRIYMMNRRLSLETNPNPIVEDTTVHPINPRQEGPSISTIVVEQAPHGSNQEAKRRCSLGDVSIPTSSQSDKLPSQDEAHEETPNLLSGCGYTSDEVREALDILPTVEEENVIHTIDEDVGLPQGDVGLPQTMDEDVGLPPSNYQEENEGHQATTETPERLGDALHGTIPTPLPPLASTRRRTPKRIQVDERLMNSIEGTLSKRSIAYQTQQILDKYFVSKCDGDKCRLFLSLLKSRSMNVVRKKLGIKMIKNSEPSSHIVKSLVDAFGKIGKNTRSKDRNAARRVLSQSIADKNTRALRILRPTSKLVNLNVKTLRRYSIRREHLDTTDQTDFWAFVGRLPRRDMKLVDAVKGLVHSFWHDHTRPSSNRKDVLKLRRGSKDREPHTKHLLDITQTELYEKFKNEHRQLNLGQRSFEKCKPWYVRINTLRNTCCCRYHVEYEYYYETFLYIRRVLHTNIVQDCSMTIPPTSSREFIHSIMCNRPEGQTYYAKSCLDGTCSNCAGMALLSQCMHENGDSEFGKMVTDMKSFKYINYEIVPGKESKKIQLVTSQVQVSDFIKEFIEKTHQYVQHVHVARWQDEKFRICRDTFPLGTILSVVDFAENYTLQPQNEIQSQYYHSEQVSLMVHITYRHGPNSTEEQREILKEYHFYISDDRCHDFHYVRHCFIMFYDHLKGRNIQMDRHWIWSDGCAGQFKNARIFQWLCSLHKNYKVPHMWNYFETGHGKGEHDGAGACVKTALRREELKVSTESTILNAQSTVRWCTSVMGEESTMRVESTRKRHVERFFWEVVDIDRSHAWECKTVPGTRGFHSVRSSDNPVFEIWTRKLACFCPPCCDGDWDGCESLDWVDGWDRISLPLDQRAIVELTPLEEDQSSISADFDHVSDLVQPGHIYAVVASKDTEWGDEYWLARCIDGKQTLIVSMTDDENNHFPTGSMVVKGEYLTRDNNGRKKGGYVYRDYKPGASVYHFTNLIIGTNLQVRTMPSRNTSKVRYFLPDTEHERLMETISIRDDPEGLVV